MEKVIGNWSIELNVTCPYCEHWFNACSTQYLEDLPAVGESQRNLEIEITCERCGADFELTETQF